MLASISTIFFPPLLPSLLFFHWLELEELSSHLSASTCWSSKELQAFANLHFIKRPVGGSD